MKNLFLYLLALQMFVVILRRTFIGKILMMCFKISKEMIKIDYQIMLSIYKFINKKTSAKKSKPQKEKKVVNGNNVVSADFNKKSFKKWNK